MRASTLAKALAGAVALAPALAAPAARAAVQNADVVVVVPDGSVARTSFTTYAGHPYVITVTGLFTYNGGGDFADCGHWHPPGADEWTWGGFVEVDGSAAACVDQPYNEAHTYQWSQIGTGDRFSFSVWDATYEDDTGALVFTVTPV